MPKTELKQEYRSAAPFIGMQSETSQITGNAVLHSSRNSEYHLWKWFRCVFYIFSGACLCSLSKVCLWPVVIAPHSLFEIPQTIGQVVGRGDIPVPSCHFIIFWSYCSRVGHYLETVQSNLSVYSPFHGARGKPTLALNGRSARATFPPSLECARRLQCT